MGAGWGRLGPAHYMRNTMRRKAKCGILLATRQVRLWLAVREQSAISCNQLSRAHKNKSKLRR